MLEKLTEAVADIISVGMIVCFVAGCLYLLSFPIQFLFEVITK